MKKIKTYDFFKESDFYDRSQHGKSIYDWFEDLKRLERTGSSYNIGTQRNIKLWSDHFIGDGWYDKTSNHLDLIFNSLKKVDIDYISDKMYDVYDELPMGISKLSRRCVLYGDPDRSKYELSRRFNGIVTVGECGDGDKLRMIIHILKEMIYPTLFVGQFPYRSKNLRVGKDEVFVTDKKYQCQNFNSEEFPLDSTYTNLMMPNRGTDSYTFTTSKRYDINLFLDMYQPGIYISIKSDKSFDLGKVEKGLDSVLPSILSDLDYKEVIFDHKRGIGEEKAEIVTYDYDLKILLNL